MRNIAIGAKRFLLPCAAMIIMLSLYTSARCAAPVQSAKSRHSSTSSIEQKVNALLNRMTMDEKLSMVHGWPGSPYVGYVPAIPRLGIPALKLEDGPAGVADGMTKVTAFPAPISISASWDPSLMKRYGRTLAEEEWGKGANIALAPTVNILRNPVWGRSFESLGEDPYLNGRMGVASILGIQSVGVIATVKHYDAYNQEYDRGNGSVTVSERALHEIYMPAFDAAIKEAYPGAVMPAYNRINGTFCSENRYILHDVLKGEWKYPGFTMSDWGGTHSTLAAANNGLDMEMPDNTFFGAPLKKAVQDGNVSMSVLDDKVRRILRQMFRFNLFTRIQNGNSSSVVTSPEHTRLALNAEEEGTVLLKNKAGILPLNSKRIHTIALIGYDASTNPKAVGGGSASVVPPYVITPLAGIRKRAGSNIQVSYAEGVASTAGALPAIPSQYLSPSEGDSTHGLKAEYFSNKTFSGEPVITKTDSQINFNWHGGSPGDGIGGAQWSARWNGILTPPQNGQYTFSLTSDDGSRLFIDDKLLINNWGDHASQSATGSILLSADHAYHIRIEYYQGTGESLISLGWRMPGGVSLFSQATDLARNSDAAIVFVNDDESEGGDRSNLTLPNSQDDLINAVANANPRTIVVLNTGAPVLMPWIEKVAGVVEAWYPGQEDGNAIAAVLFGDVNPSAKLPMTFPQKASDIPANTPAQYPGINEVSKYSEGIFVGYRHYDKAHITPLFPFGYGLSYTHFAYKNLEVKPSKMNVNVTLDIKNTGGRAGAEVVQVYVGDPAITGEPPKQLAGFQKVSLKPGQTRRVTITINPRSFAHWDTIHHAWIISRGAYQIMAGSSSRDILLKRTIELSGDH
jgi:beta-glucosidase